jgi:hypothetical protein
VAVALLSVTNTCLQHLVSTCHTLLSATESAACIPSKDCGTQYIEYSVDASKPVITIVAFWSTEELLKPLLTTKLPLLGNRPLSYATQYTYPLADNSSETVIDCLVTLNATVLIVGTTDLRSNHTNADWITEVAEQVVAVPHGETVESHSLTDAMVQGLSQSTHIPTVPELSHTLTVQVEPPQTAE